MSVTRVSLPCTGNIRNGDLGRNSGKEEAVEFRVLGSVELWAHGRRHEPGSRKERCLLAALLWEEGRPIAADTLIEWVWGDKQPSKPLNSLYAIVSRLRTTLHRASGDRRDRLLRRSAGAYRLDATSDVVDLLQFRSLRDEAKTAAANGDDVRAFTLLNEMEQLWRGTPLAGLDGAWAERVRLRLEEERYHARLNRIEAGLRLGGYTELVGEATELAAQRPLAERPVEYLMRALCMSGRRAEASHAYLDFRRRNADATGGEPGARLRDLQQRMLREAPELDPRPPERPARAYAPTRTMPRDTPDFTGRAEDLDRISGWLTGAQAQSTVPVIVISGMAGVGKSALALHAARAHERHCPDQLYVDLRGHRPDEDPENPGTALGNLLHGLGVPDALIPLGVEDRAALWRSRLTDRRVLILLDDAHDAEQVRPLLPGAPGCVVLITTRKAVDLPGMHYLSLEPMPPTDAATLFARASGRERTDDPHVASVLRLCDYLPLEIRIAGSEMRRHPAWGVGDLATRLRENRAEDRPVGAALRLTCHYLTAQQKRLLRQLSLHPGPDFSTHVAAALAGEPSYAETRHALDGLQDYHLIEEPAPGRFSFHDLIRSYASHLAATHDSEDDRLRSMRRMVDYYIWLADSAGRAILPFRRRSPSHVDHVPANPPLLHGPSDYRKWLESEQHTLLAVARYAIAWGLAEQAGMLAHELAWFLDARNCWTDAADLHRCAVEAWRAAGNSQAEAMALSDLCRSLGRMGRYQEAFACARQALVIAHDTADHAQEAEVLDNLGLILLETSRFPEALSHFDQALTAWQALGDKHGEADVLSHSAGVLSNINQPADAMRRTERALDLYRALGDVRGEANALSNLGEYQLGFDCHEQALDSYQRALGHYRNIGDRLGQAAAAVGIGDVRLRTEAEQEALARYRTALDICRDIGHRRGEAEIRNKMGSAYRRLGHYGEALDQHHKALVLSHELADRSCETQAHHGSGDAHLSAGDLADACVSYRAALEISKRIGDDYQEAQALHGLGQALAPGDDTAATGHLSQALSILTRIGKSREADLVRGQLHEVQRLEAGTGAAIRSG